MHQASNNPTTIIEASIEVLQRRFNWDIYQLENPEPKKAFRPMF